MNISTTHISTTIATLARRGLCVSVLGFFLAACEAPLNLEQVAAESDRRLHRYDMLQAAAHVGDRVAVVSSIGAIVTSADSGTTWVRQELPGRPSLIDVTACKKSGEFFALDSERRVWRQEAASGDWVATPVETSESTLSIHCAPNGRVWVSASFGTLYWSDVSLSAWNEFSLYEDLQFTAVRFVDDMHGFALGEFGTVMTTADGGDNWETREPIPNEFYPMAADFLDASSGWVGGLDGVIWHTADGGNSWQRQETVTTAPIYNIHANGHGVFAVGGSAKLVELKGDTWKTFEGGPEVLAFMRGLDTLANGSLLVAGGGGTLAVIPLGGRSSAEEG
jgi:photosystem II stability/assembly factor-like uncharacterized protein